jgi:hypothetical protein
MGLLSLNLEDLKDLIDLKVLIHPKDPMDQAHPEFLIVLSLHDHLLVHLDHLVRPFLISHLIHLFRLVLDHLLDLDFHLFHQHQEIHMDLENQFLLKDLLYHQYLLDLSLLFHHHYL